MFFKEGGKTGRFTQPIRQTDPKDGAQLGAFLLREALQEEQQLWGKRTGLEDGIGGKREDDWIDTTESWLHLAHYIGLLSRQ